MKIRTQADIAALEKVPVTKRIAHTNVLDLLRDVAQRHGDRTAFRYLAGTGLDDPVRDVTYEAMFNRTIQAANLLQAQGVGPNDVVTLLMPSLPETFFA